MRKLMAMMGWLASAVSLFAGPGMFDSQEILDGFLYPAADRGKLEIRRNIGMTLSVYESFCVQKGVEMLPEFVRTVREGKGRLNLRNLDIGCRDVEALACALRINRTVRAIDLGGIPLGGMVSRMLREAAERNPALSRIDLEGCCIGEAEAAKWSELAKQRDISAPLAVFGLRKRTHFEADAALYLDACGEWEVFPRRETLALLRGGLEHVRLPFASAGWTNGGDGVAPGSGSYGETRALCDVLSKSGSVKRLTVNGKAGLTGDCRDLLTAAALNSNLSAVRVEGLNFDAGTAGWAAGMLGPESRISELALSGCSFMTDSTLPAFTAALAASGTLRSLVFRDNRFRREEFAELVRVLACENESVTNLSINGVSIDNDPNLPALAKKFPPR